MLANCIIGLPAPFLLRCFISRLASEIRREVQALHPLTLVQAVGLARLQEEKLADQCRGVSRGFRSRAQLALGFSLPSAPFLPPIPPLLPSPAKPPPLNVRRLSPEEITMRQEKGLCFNCNKRFSRGHKCSSRFSLLFAAVEEEDEPSCTNPNITPNISDPPALDPTQAQISLYALVRHLAPETLRLMGRVAQHCVSILIDGGSTHNFVQERLVRSLGLQVQPTHPLQVVVGNGNELACHQLCPGVELHIQDQTFIVDLHVLPLCGVDLVLGVQWLKSLGPDLTDYNDLTFKFFHHGKIIELKGHSDSDLHTVTPNQLRRITQTDSASVFLHIRVLHLASTTPATSQYLEIATFLTQFSTLFQTPTSLPPS